VMNSRLAPCALAACSARAAAGRSTGPARGRGLATTCCGSATTCLLGLVSTAGRCAGPKTCVGSTETASCSCGAP
jgi:hypothetical protein